MQCSKACEASLEKRGVLDSLSCAAKVSLFKLSLVEASFVVLNVVVEPHMGVDPQLTT